MIKIGASAIKLPYTYFLAQGTSSLYKAMKRKHFHIFIFSFFFFIIILNGHSTKLFAQDTDSLTKAILKIQTRINDAKHESTQPNGWMIALKYYSEAFKMAQNIGYLEAQSEALRGIAKVESGFGSRNQQALKYMLQEIAIRNSLDAPLETAKSYLIMGEILDNQLFTPQNALGYYQQALHLQEKFNENPQERLKTLDKIVGVYKYLSQDEALLATELRKLQLLQGLDSSKTALAQTTLSISKAYLALDSLEQALDYAIDAQQYLSPTDPEAADYLESLEKRWKAQQESPERYNPYIWWALIIFSVFMSFLAIRQKISHLYKAKASKRTS